METTETSLMTDQINIATVQQYCYPGESVTYQIRFTVEKTKDVKLQVEWPDVVEVLSVHLPEGLSPLLATIAQDGNLTFLLLPLHGNIKPGREYLIEVSTRINTFFLDQHLHAEAKLVRGGRQVLSEETARLAVFSQSRILKYLPEIYHGNEFLSRYLMLFESFWQPIQQTTRQIHHYFDPKLTPEPFVPWLATWFGVPLDDFLPIDRTRELLRHALTIYQLRGTAQALEEFLKVYTGGEVQITEHRASNFVLNQDNRLGLGRALGKQNQAMKVIVDLQVPQDELTRSGLNSTQFRKKMAEVIQTMVPAHILFDVNCEFIQ
jgi:phage tail-like protein